MHQNVGRFVYWLLFNNPVKNGIGIDSRTRYFFVRSLVSANRRVLMRRGSSDGVFRTETAKAA